MSANTSPTRPPLPGTPVARMLRINAIRDTYGISVPAIRRKIEDGTLVAVHIGRSVYVTAASVEAMFGLDQEARA